MKEKLTKLLKKEMFHPKFIGFLFNPFYIIRRGLYKGIKANTPLLKGKLLDFGCGSKPYRELFDVEEYIGVDIEESGHSHKNESIDVYYNGKELPFEDHFFDSIFSSEVFEHVFELDNILRELHRVCKPNGHILITVPFVWDEHEVPYDFGRYSSFGIKYILEKHGFEIITQTKTTNYVETITQMWCAYISQHILRNKVIRIILNPFVIMPTMILGILISKILPKHKGFFCNNIVLAKRL